MSVTLATISVPDIVCRLAYNVYTSPEDKTKDAATLALYIAYDGEVPQTSLAQPPREMLIEALGILNEASAGT